MAPQNLKSKRLKEVVEISQSMLEEDLPEGDEINMCKAMDQLFQRMRDEGKLNTLKEQLKVKLGTISSPLEEKLTTTSLEKLNELTLNIFNINSEEDVLKIIC